MKIGITGGIGSGKSTVAAIFAVLGIPVYDADSRAKWLMVHQPELVAAIQKLFGAQAYQADGRLNRSHIADIAFNDPQKIQKLNALVHPVVKLDYEQWHDQQNDVPYTLKEAALLFESGSAYELDAVIEVFAAQEIRIQRVRKRNGWTRQHILSRIRHQMPERQKRKLADYVLVNDGKKGLINQVLALDKKLRKRGEAQLMSPKK
ncbi:MAG TPA: dephospho-CoA kinase [Saprospiraceae bacterium]|nr:dephospho-CoA kinase [Saprospiraceae bacterium]